jgi:Bacterial self-protective colicin-like immunity
VTASTTASSDPVRRSGARLTGTVGIRQPDWHPAYRTIMSDVTDRYIPLITGFVDGDVDASTFQHKFLELWKEDRDSGIGSDDILDDLMTGVDSYDENPDVLMGIDADQLRGEAREALHRITRL